MENMLPVKWEVCLYLKIDEIVRGHIIDLLLCFVRFRETIFQISMFNCCWCCFWLCHRRTLENELCVKMNIMLLLLVMNVALLHDRIHDYAKKELLWWLPWQKSIFFSAFFLSLLDSWKCHCVSPRLYWCLFLVSISQSRSIHRMALCGHLGNYIRKHSIALLFWINAVRVKCDWTIMSGV